MPPVPNVKGFPGVYSDGRLLSSQSFTHLMTSAALDASVKNTPGLYVRNDTDLVAKVNHMYAIYLRTSID